MNTAYCLTLSCNDQPGIVSAVTTALYDAGANIIEAQQFDDVEQGVFFMRVEFRMAGEATAEDSLKARLSPLKAQFNMQLRLRSKTHRQRVLIMVSKLDHCLVDLLYRNSIGELSMDIVAVVSNHPRESINTSLLGDIPFHYLPISKETKAEQEAALKEVIDQADVELVILARYMQILSAEMTSFLEGRCINIHHSFLPGFKGGRPYHQAYARGVKMIGATAHYVNSDLDEGPIIVQDVETVSHSDTPESLVRKGRDIERRVLARAVHYHLEDRVLLNKSKTVVFKD